MSNGADKMVMDRERRKQEKLEAKVEAMSRNLSRGIANALKDENTRQAIARDALNATERSRRGDVDRRYGLTDNAGGGLYFEDEEDVITGNEPLPWDADDFDPFNSR